MADTQLRCYSDVFTQRGVRMDGWAGLGGVCKHTTMKKKKKHSVQKLKTYVSDTKICAADGEVERHLVAAW